MKKNTYTRDIVSIALIIASLWVYPLNLWAQDYGALRALSLADRNNGGLAAGNAVNSAELRDLRNSMSKLPSYSLSAACLWGVLDLLLARNEADIPPDLAGQDVTLREYRDTRRFLAETHPDLLPENILSIQRLESQPQSTIVCFEIRTRTNDRYVLAVQTANQPARAFIRLSGLTDEFYRLNEILTGPEYPWEPPFNYRRGYLEGTTNKAGDPINGKGKLEAWSVDPGSEMGNFHIYKVEPEEPSVRWSDITAEPADEGSAGLMRFQENVTNQQHLFVVDRGLGVAAHIASKPNISGQEGAYLIVAFPNGNAGLGIFDKSIRGAYEISDVKAIRRKLNQRGVQFTLRSGSPRCEIAMNDIVFNTMRHIREWSSPIESEKQKRRKLYSRFKESVDEMPRSELRELRREGIPLHEVYRRIFPVIRLFPNQGVQRLYILRYSVSNHFYLMEMEFPIGYAVDFDSQGIRVDSHGEPVSCRVTATTDFPVSELWSREQLFTPEALALAERSGAFNSTLMHVQFLLSHGINAGSNRFLQYFSRDTLVWLRHFAWALTPRAHEMTLQNVFDRVNANGELPTVDEVYDQCVDETIEKFCDAFPSAAGDNYRKLKGIARTLQKPPSSILKYGVPDVNLMLLPAIADYLQRSDIPNEEKVSFMRRQAASGIPNFRALLHNLDWVSSRAVDFNEAQRQAAQTRRETWPAGMIYNPNKDDFGNWRDVTYGLGEDGRIPADVNAELMPMALEAVQVIDGQLKALPLDEANEKTAWQNVLAVMGQEQGLNQLRILWRDGAGERIVLERDAGQVREELRHYFAHSGVGPHARGWLRSQRLSADCTVGDFLRDRDPKTPPILASPVEYFPVALTANGEPVPITASDSITGLFDMSLSQAQIMDILIPLLMPYPVGLWMPIGVLAASPTLSQNENMYRTITNQAYGGCVVYLYQMEDLRQGLSRQLSRLAAMPGKEQDVNHRLLLQAVYSAWVEAGKAAKLGENREITTWDIGPLGFKYEHFGTRLGDNDEGSVSQLWSTSSNEMNNEEVLAIASHWNLQPLSGGELLDRFAELRQVFPTVHHRVIAGAEAPKRPGVAELMHSFGAGGGVNIVGLDHVENLLLLKFPSSLVIGQMLTGEAGVETYQGKGTAVHLIPEVDLNSDVERRAWAGEYDMNRNPAGHAQAYGELRAQVDALKTKLRQSLANVDIVVIHQIMVMPSNPVATLALKELAEEYRGKKRFIAWIHNSLKQRITTWPMSAITTMDPNMEYVAVSKPQRDLAADIFGVNPNCIRIIRNSRGFLTFGGMPLYTYQFFLKHGLFDPNIDFILLYPSRMERSKCIEAAIYTVDEARRQGLDIRLIISTVAINRQFPTGDGGEAQYLRELQSLADSLGLLDPNNPRVLFYPHAGDQAELRALYEHTNGLIFPTETETDGLPLREAMMSGRILFRTDLPVLNDQLLGQNIDQPTFPPKGPNMGMEHYGRQVVAPKVLGTLRSNPVLFNIAKSQRVPGATSSEAVFYGAVRPYLSIPAARNRYLGPSARNFYGRKVEEEIAAAVQGGFSSFEINCEGFAPWDIKEDGRQKIREAIAAGSKTSPMNISIRLTDFYKWPSKPPFDILREAAQLAKNIGASVITISVGELTPQIAEAIIQASNLPEFRDRVMFSIENVTSGPNARRLEPYELNIFSGKKIGVSIWLDSLPENAMGYVSTIQLQITQFYAGSVFAGAGYRPMVEGRVSNLMQWLHIQDPDKRYNIVGHAPLESPAKHRILLDTLTADVYLTPAQQHSLETGVVGVPPEFQLEELAPEIKVIEDASLAVLSQI